MGQKSGGDPPLRNDDLGLLWTSLWVILVNFIMTPLKMKNKLGLEFICLESQETNIHVLLILRLLNSIQEENPLIVKEGKPEGIIDCAMFF